MNKLLPVIALVVFLIAQVSGAIIGISPASLKMDNLLRGGYGEGSVFITSDLEEAVEVNVEARGEIAGWINLSKWTFEVSRENPQKFDVFIRPPFATPNGNYSGYVRVRTEALGTEREGYVTGQVLSSVDLKIEVSVTDKEILECDAFEMFMAAVEEGYPAILNFSIKNKGNILIGPEFRISVWDRDQTKIAHTEIFQFEEILPGKQLNSIFDVDSSGLEVGQYFVEVNVPDCVSSNIISFDVLEEGALRADGVITSMVTREEGKVGEIVPIEINFKNTGQKEVNAKFIGEVLQDNRIVASFDTDRVRVPIGAIEKFRLSFVPTNQGKHAIRGYVLYDNKKTFEATASTNIYGGISLSVLLIYGALILGIIFLFFKIYHEKRRYQRILSRKW